MTFINNTPETLTICAGTSVAEVKSQLNCTINAEEDPYKHLDIYHVHSNLGSGFTTNNEIKETFGSLRIDMCKHTDNYDQTVFVVNYI